jgi:hypothetical protein
MKTKFRSKARLHCQNHNFAISQQPVRRCHDSFISRHFGALRPNIPPMQVGAFFLWEETP